MADLDLLANQGLTDKRIGRGTTASTPLVEIANMEDIDALKTRLAALDGTSYTTARMNNMTRNDLLYALRVASSDAAGI